jgi:hypothetical protein
VTPRAVTLLVLTFVVVSATRSAGSAEDPTPRPNHGWANWWYIKVTGIRPGETLTLDVGEAPWATPDRAAFSLDQQAWRQTEPGVRRGKRIEYRQQVDAAEAWFAWGSPFTPGDAKGLVDWAAAQSADAAGRQLGLTIESYIRSIDE